MKHACGIGNSEVEEIKLVVEGTGHKSFRLSSQYFGVVLVETLKV